jgi:hypothetical protein
VGGWYWGTTREGPAISRARAAVVFTTLGFLLSSATAHAKASLVLTEGSARAGDLVHFTISGVDGSTTYALLLDGMQVSEGTADGPISGAFTVPDLGDGAWTVTIAADIRRPGKRRWAESKLGYLGPALPVTPPSAPPPAPATPVVPQVSEPTQPVRLPDTTEPSKQAPAVVTRPRRRRQSRKPHPLEPHPAEARSGRPRRHANRGRDRRNHHRSETRKTHSKRKGRRRAPLSLGIPEPTGGARQPGPNPAVSRPGVLVATGAHAVNGGGAHAAVLVPAVLGLAALGLAGTAVLRRRRLATRPRRD